jgi:hypothetical protein
MMLAALALCGLALAGADGCRRCEQRGMIPCAAHPEYEGGVLFCSVAAACTACGGSLLVDCKYCEGGPDTAVAAERLAVIQKWAPTGKLDELFGRTLPRFETERFHLVIETGELREGKKKVDQHQIGHHVAADVQAVERLMAPHFQVKEGDYRSRMRMWIWTSAKDHALAMEKFLGSTATGDFKILGMNPVFSVWTEKPHFDEVPEVRSLFAHNAAHMLLSNLHQPEWIGDIGGGWLDAAIGHWYEYAIFGRTTNYCIEEATLPESYENGQWRAAIRKRLESEKEPFLPVLITKNTGAMRQSEQALCWSFFDWLVANHPAVLRGIAEDLKQKKPTRSVLQERLGMDVLAAEAAWRAWVPAVYPTKGDVPRSPEAER